MGGFSWRKGKTQRENIISWNAFTTDTNNCSSTTHIAGTRVNFYHERNSFNIIWHEAWYPLASHFSTLMTTFFLLFTIFRNSICRIWSKSPLWRQGEDFQYLCTTPSIITGIQYDFLNWNEVKNYEKLTTTQAVLNNEGKNPDIDYTTAHDTIWPNIVSKFSKTCLFNIHKIILVSLPLATTYNSLVLQLRQSIYQMVFFCGWAKIYRQFSYKFVHAAVIYMKFSINT